MGSCRVSFVHFVTSVNNISGAAYSLSLIKQLVNKEFAGGHCKTLQDRKKEQEHRGFCSLFTDPVKHGFLKVTCRFPVCGEAFEWECGHSRIFVLSQLRP